MIANITGTLLINTQYRVISLHLEVDLNSIDTDYRDKEVLYST